MTVAAISIAGAIFFISSYEKSTETREETVLTSIPVILVDPIGVPESQRELQKPFTESVISGLSVFRGINVLSGNNSFFISNSDLSDTQIAEKFNVDFIVRGIIQTYGDKSRMNISLADLEQNKVIWSDQIDFNLEEIFELQDRVNDSILSQLQVEAVAGDIVNDLREYAQNFEFLTLYLNWSAEIQKWNPESHSKAETLLSEMNRLDSDNRLLHSATGWQSFQRIVFGLSTSFESDVEIMKNRNALAIQTMGRGEDYAQRAMFEYFFFSKTCEAALADVEASLKRGQNVRVHQITGAIYAACDRVGDAIIYNRKALAATPNDIGWFLTVDLVSNLWKLDRYEEIKEVIEPKIDAADMDPRITAIYAVVEQKAGNKKRAKELIARAKNNGLVPDRIKTWLRGQPAAFKLIEQINEIDTF
jgi:TolB-like protein